MTEKFKKVNETIFGIKIDDTKNNTHDLAQAFGWKAEWWSQFAVGLNDFTNYIQAEYHLDETEPTPTKLSILVDFLKSDLFTKIGIPIETPNDYVMVGVAWAAAMAAREQTERHHHQGDLPEALKELMESMPEDLKKKIHVMAVKTHKHKHKH